MTKEDFNFSYHVKVRYSEVDHQGIVYNSHYLEYADETAVAYLKEINFVSVIKPNVKKLNYFNHFEDKNIDISQSFVVQEIEPSIIIEDLLYCFYQAA